jgi:hypothetical protein
MHVEDLPTEWEDLPTDLSRFPLARAVTQMMRGTENLRSECSLQHEFSMAAIFVILPMMVSPSSFVAWRRANPGLCLSDFRDISPKGTLNGSDTLDLSCAHS